MLVFIGLEVCISNFGQNIGMINPHGEFLVFKFLNWLIY